MLKIEHTEVLGWEASIRGMRNPMNSWNKSDSFKCDYDREDGYCAYCPYYYYESTEDGTYDECCLNEYANHVIGQNDLDLMKRLVKAGTDHSKFMRMITVYVDITAPLYFWKEFKTYRAGRKFSDTMCDVIDSDLLEMDIEMNSCSTMHKIHAKEFELSDFSCEHLLGTVSEDDKHCVWYNNEYINSPLDVLEFTIDALNVCRKAYLETKDKKYWWQMIQLLPTSYNQKRTVQLNYAVLRNMYHSRKNHKLDEWHTFCEWISSLPYSDLITM